MVNTPIVKLSRSSSIHQDASIRAVVSLLWPYSSLTKHCAFLLADPDFRLRNHRGQIRVLFAGPAAEAIASSRIGIGDAITLRLEGASWSEEQDVTSTPGRNVDTPGKSVDGELLFDRKLHLKFVQHGVEREVHVNAGDYVEPAQDPILPPVKANVMTRSKLRTLGDAVPVYSSPAFAKRMRHSMENYVDFAQDPFDSTTQQDEDIHATPFNGVKQWRVTTRTPSPVKESFPAVAPRLGPVILSPLMIPTQDSPSPVKRQTLDADRMSPTAPSPAQSERSQVADSSRSAVVAEVVSLLSPGPDSPIDHRGHVRIDRDDHGEQLEANKDLSRNYESPTSKQTTEDPIDMSVKAAENTSSPVHSVEPATLRPVSVPLTRKRRRDAEFDEMYDLSEPEDEPEPESTAIEETFSTTGHHVDGGLHAGTFSQQDAREIGQDEGRPGFSSAHKPRESVASTMNNFDMAPDLTIESQVKQIEDSQELSGQGSTLEGEDTQQQALTTDLSESLISTVEKDAVMAQTFQSLFGFGTRPAESTDSESVAQSIRSAVDDAIEVIDMRSPNYGDSHVDSTISAPRALLDSFQSLPPDPEFEGSIRAADLPSQVSTHSFVANEDVNVAVHSPTQQVQPVGATDATSYEISETQDTITSTVADDEAFSPSAADHVPMYDSQPSLSKRATDTLLRDSGYAGSTEHMSTAVVAADAREVVDILSASESESDSEDESDGSPDPEELAEEQALTSAWDNFVESARQEHEALEQSEGQSVNVQMKQATSLAPNKILENGPAAPSVQPPPSLPPPTLPTRKVHLEVMETPKPPVRKSFSSRLSGLPATMATWFSPKADAAEQPQPKLPATTKKSTSSGLRTSYGYFTPLSQLERLVNSQHLAERGGVDVIAVVTTASKEPTRATSGPRDYYTIMEVTDTSVSGQKVRVEVYRPWKAKLPVAEVGDVVLLRSFAVKSRRRQPYLLSSDESAYCVWRFADAEKVASNAELPAWARKETVGQVDLVREEMKGPAVEFGEEERQQVETLKQWYDEEHDNNEGTAVEMNGHAAQELTAKS